MATLLKLEYEGLKEQLQKVGEEFDELQDEILEDEVDLDKVKAEAWDVIQATLGILFTIHGDSNIITSYCNHVAKLQKRYEDDQIIIKKFIQF
jgi:FtsZ-binding cell division protein ZapB